MSDQAVAQVLLYNGTLTEHLINEQPMSVPDFQSLMLPTLKALADGSEAPVKDIDARVRDSENLTSKEVEEMQPSGRQTVFVSRIRWALTYMGRAGLLERTRRGVYRLMPEGSSLLSESPSRIDLKLLQQYPPYAEWKRQSPSSDKEVVDEQSSEMKETPDELFDRAAQQLCSELEAEVLDRLRKATPAFFERAIVKLLIEMGYGGGDPAMGRVMGRPGDGGIDGEISQDKLGLEKVYIQAKRYSEDNNVGAGDLRDFAGAIDAAKTNKGVFVTTASFAKGAKDFVKRVQKRIVLINGAELARLMVCHGVGVQTRETYEIKRIDEDYFDQEV